MFQKGTRNLKTAHRINTLSKDVSLSQFSSIVIFLAFQIKGNFAFIILYENLSFIGDREGKSTCTVPAAKDRGERLEVERLEAIGMRSFHSLHVDNVNSSFLWGGSLFRRLQPIIPRRKPYVRKTSPWRSFTTLMIKTPPRTQQHTYARGRNPIR